VSQALVVVVMEEYEQFSFPRLFRSEQIHVSRKVDVLKKKTHFGGHGRNAPISSEIYGVCCDFHNCLLVLFPSTFVVLLAKIASVFNLAEESGAREFGGAESR
jgi:hypothetical protein